MNIGFRVYTEAVRMPVDLIERFREHSVPNIADAMHGMNTMDAGIRPAYSPMKPVAGTAITAVLTPGDGLMLRKALELAGPGDVVVVNGFGSLERALLGGNVCISAGLQGLKGFVIDGAIRDPEEIRTLDMPVMARGITPRSGTTASGWGEVNVPIACGGVVVSPGDLVVADGDGAVVIPVDGAVPVLEALEAVARQKGKPSELGARVGRQADLPSHGSRVVNTAMAERQATVISGRYRWGDA
jgi:4-hydroxy-4-methyl-2-oxoglutarate aldolase